MVLRWLFLPPPTSGYQPGDYAIMNLLALCLPSPSPHPPSPSKTMISPLHNRTACTWEVKSGLSTHLWHSDRSSLRGFWKGRGVASNPLPNMLEEGFTWPSQLPMLKKNILLKSYSSCYLIYLSCTAGYTEPSKKQSRIHNFYLKKWTTVDQPHLLCSSLT